MRTEPSAAAPQLSYPVTVVDLLQKPHLLALELLETLYSDPQLAPLYDLSAGVSEGYTLYQHTKMVLDQAETHKNAYVAQIEALIPWNYFLLFLALHDIGKGPVVANPLLQQTKIQRKSGELEETCKVIQSFLTEHNLDGLLPSGVNFSTICQTLLADDTQGLYCVGSLTFNSALTMILRNAARANLDPANFYALMTIFHRFDASAYPSLLEHFFTAPDLTYCEKNKTKTDALAAQLELLALGKSACDQIALLEASDTHTIEEIFTLHIKAIRTYFQAQHLHMLETFERPHANFSGYKNLCATLKKCYQAPFHNSENKQSILSNYQNIKKHSTLSNISFDKTPLAIARNNKCEEETNEEEKKKLGLNHKEVLVSQVEIFCELLEFNQNLLHRYEVEELPSRLEISIKNQLENLSEEAKKSLKEEWEYLSLKNQWDNFKPYLKIIFLHGSNSRVLPLLESTALEIHPTGALTKETNIILQTGELNNGCTANGINQHSISGTSIIALHQPLSYSSSYQWSLDEKVACIHNFKPLSFLTKRDPELGEGFILDMSGVASGPTCVATAYAILLVRQHSTECWSSLKELIKARISITIEAFEKFKTSETYNNSMPQSLGAPYTNYKNGNYYLNKFRAVEHGLTLLKDALTREIPLPSFDTKVLPIPLMFGSYTTYTKPVCAMGGGSEVGAPNWLKLGIDIQYIYYPPTAEGSHIVQDFLERNKLGDKIINPGLEDLERAQKFIALATKYDPHYDILGL